MLVLEFVVISLVGGSVLAAGMIVWDRWRERVQTRALEEANKEE
jgi:hypothetical protein